MSSLHPSYKAKTFIECHPKDVTIVPNIQRLSEISNDFQWLQGTFSILLQTFKSQQQQSTFGHGPLTADIQPVTFNLKNLKGDW